MTPTFGTCGHALAPDGHFHPVYYLGKEHSRLCCGCAGHLPDIHKPEQPSVGLPVQAANLEGLNHEDNRPDNNKIASSFLQQETEGSTKTIQGVCKTGAIGQAVAPGMEGGEELNCKLCGENPCTCYNPALGVAHPGKKHAAHSKVGSTRQPPAKPLSRGTKRQDKGNHPQGGDKATGTLNQGGNGQENERRTMSEDTQTPKTEARIQIDYTPGRWGKVVSISDLEGKTITLGHKAAIKMARTLIKILREKV